MSKRLIKLCTSHEAVVERMTYVVGLPVQRSFYQKQGKSNTSVSPFISIDALVVLEIIERAFRRSTYTCYRRYASILATYLRSILLVSATDDGELESLIRDRLIGLRERLAQAEA